MLAPFTIYCEDILETYPFELSQSQNPVVAFRVENVASHSVHAVALSHFLHWRGHALISPTALEAESDLNLADAST